MNRSRAGNALVLRCREHSPNYCNLSLLISFQPLNCRWLDTTKATVTDFGNKIE